MRSRLGKAEREIVKALAGHKGAMSIQELADACGYAVSGGGFRNSVGSLRTLELIEGRSDELRVHPDFAEAIG